MRFPDPISFCNALRNTGAGEVVATDPRLVEAVATSPVPHLRVELAAGTGRAYRPRFVFRWPHSQALERSGRLHDDGVLDPRDTRTALGIALSAVHSGGLQ